MSTDFEDEVRELRAELEQVAADYTEVWQRQEQARRVRFNEWAGQSSDGRKHGDALDGEALPFEGAPDNRIPLADAAINEKVALLVLGFFRAQVQAKPVESNDAAKAANVNALLTWLRDRVMRSELETEVELAAQYLYGDDPGVVVVEVTWLRDLMLERRPLTFDELAGMFATGAQSPEEAKAMAEEQGGVQMEPELLAEFMDLATNPARSGEWMQWLGAMFPGATGKALRAAARDLKRDNFAALPVPTIRENRPQVQTLKIGDDIFPPIGTVDIQRARHVPRREWLSDVELRERVHTLGWDAAWVEEVIERGKGQSVLSDTWRMSAQSLSGPGHTVNERDNLFEVIWSYRREADELGIPGIVCTVWSGVVKDRVAKRSVADYPHGKYPYVMRTRERLGRQTTDSRGLTVPLMTHQNEIKVQRDARGAHVQLLASPPIKTKVTRGAFELVLGPNAQVPVQKMDDFDVVPLPNFMQNSVEMERTTRDEADHYAGLMRPDGDPNRTSLLQQHEVNNFFALWRDVFGMVLPLAQTYFSEAELARVTGQQDMPMALTPEDVGGGYDVTLEIDARDMNMEFAMKKMDAYGKLKSYDAAGRLDNAEFIDWAARAIDPILAARTVTPMGRVTKKIVDEERQNVTGMALGVEPVMDPDGTTNPSFRLQTMAQTIQQSPRLQTLFAGDEMFRQLVENYQKYLVQQIDQEANKTVGRLGTQPLQSVPGLYQGASALAQQ